MIGGMLCLGQAWGQTVESSIDPMQIVIGQQSTIKVSVTADAGAAVEFPQYDSLQQMVPGVEVLSISPADSQRINAGKQLTISRQYVITSFDSALYYLPPMQVTVDGKVHEASQLALKVYSVPVDTLHTDSIFGPKATMRAPFVWADTRALIWMSLGVLLLTLLLVYVLIRLKDNKPIIRRIKVKPKESAHKVALGKIEQIKSERIWQQEDSKEYYTQLTDILRQYMNDRYGFNAMEMTTSEIIAQLEEVNDEQSVSELRELFETADLVKFAKYSTQLNENDRNLLNAITYIQTTKKEEEATEQPQEIVVVNKRSRKMKWVLIAAIAVATVLLIVLFAAVVYRLIMLNI